MLVNAAGCSALALQEILLLIEIMLAKAAAATPVYLRSIVRFGDSKQHNGIVIDMSEATCSGASLRRICLRDDL